MVTYKKPSGLTYTDMAIWIDQNAYKEDCDDNLLFEYLYHLVKINAIKAKLFEKHTYYEDFSIEGATHYYFRLKNKRQFEYDNKGNPKLKKITSIVNYMKKSLYFLKVDFQQKHFSQTITTIEEQDNIDSLAYTFSDYLSENVNQLNKAEFSCSLSDFCKSIRFYLKDIPHNTTSYEWDNIYISCLLTLLNMIVLPTKEVNRINNLKRIHKIEDLEKLYNKQNSVNSVILFHLDKSMRDYIFILCKKIKTYYANDLSYMLHNDIDSHSLSYMLLQNETKNDERL